ncbi:uncharacterized protein CcaverHIS019_0510760 [Cutaneotrichosporon cavernicola]|uniref:Xylanolytic transcriptional activator regulatory domain-containing protein n=1 Tax=Cutaneotrichosporon cavernicola TaxID=279322 RepID=A0AA48L7S2_9TREE|nr:uncharacterized protein CcaverHIS019_0510760 [Cutaneotrichosporon cavernicola]BEI93448.1 hypothetical protein CcaverHIS019_0510760 [Cutaneotrichosporon cavernicola]BEJ01226.1 hypothetical protein CcaverHIS631_0510830 [Cutaneotrichosporon cavernicola]
MPPPNNRPSPNPIQSHHGHSTHSHASSHDHSHHSGADSGRSGRSVASSVTGAFESSTSEGFPVHDLLGGSGSSTSSSLLQSLPSTGVAPRRRTGDSGTPFQLTAGPLVMEPQQADFGFGLGPPDPWEALLQNTMVPNFWTEPNVPETSFDFDSLLQHGPMRPQESAERHGSGGRAGASVGGNEDMLDVGDVLLERLNNSYPDLSLTAPDLTEALELHWSLVAPSFPFIHRGTFDVDTAATELVVMMVVTGAVHSDRPRRDDGKLVRTVRSNLLKDHCGLDMQLSALQAYTLCHVFDTWYSDTESLFVAQCMWPVVVSHSRKVGIGVAGSSSPQGQGVGAWVAWAKDEERRRTAYAILLIDTQISTFWSQYPSRQLAIFAHNINLPCPATQWEACTASDWVLARQVEGSGDRPARQQRQGFQPGLHPKFQVNVIHEGYSSAVLSALAAESASSKVDTDNVFAVSLVLTGLLAIAWDCRTRGGLGLRFRDGSKHWRSIVLNAVVNLRAEHEVATAHLPPSVENRDLRDSIAIGIISILSDIPMLQVAAGSTSVCGATIGLTQFTDAERRLKLWAPTPDAWTCLWQSTRYLRDALFSDWGTYTPWAVFLTTLVVWGYASGADRTLAPPSPDLGASSSASALLDGIFRSPARVDLNAGVTDLLATAARRLNDLGQPLDRESAALLWRLAGGSGDPSLSPTRYATWRRI